MVDPLLSYCTLSILKMAAVRHLGFHVFAIFCEKNQIGTYFYVVMQNLVKIGRSTAEFCIISIFKVAAICHLDFHIFALSWKIQIGAYFYVVLQNLVMIGRSTAELLHIINFQRPPFWIWFDFIADHS